MNALTQKNEKGFTLIELLVALALAGIVSTAVFAAYNSQEKVYKSQQLVAEMQQNARAAMLMVSREVRMANAYMGRSGLDWKNTINNAMQDSDGNAFQSDVFQSGIEAFNNYDFDGDNTGDGPDRVDIVYADFDLMATITNAMPLPAAVLEVDDIADCSNGGFCEHDIVIISDGRNANVMEITGISKQGSKSKLRHNVGAGDYGINTATNSEFPPGPPSGYPAGSTIFKVKWSSFFVDTSDPDHPQLKFDRDGPLGGDSYQPLVQNIEDLQITYIMSDGAEMAQPDNGTDGTDGNDYDDVQSVRISIVARTSEPMADFTGSSRPALGDRANGAFDRYQRRVLTEEIQIRNLNLPN